MKSIRTAYFGSGESGKQVLSGLEKSGNLHVVLTYSTRLDNIEHVAETLGNEKIDVGIVCNFGQLLPEALLNLPRHGFWNVHYSLLPKFRGATPVQSAILAGEKETGVSIIQMVKELDAGDLLAQKRVPLDGTETTSDLKRKLSDIAVALLNTRLPEYVEKGGVLRPQSGTPSYCYKSLISRDNARIDWSAASLKIDRMVRAYQPDPCAWTTLKGKEIKLLGVKVVSDIQTDENTPGSCFVQGKRLFAKTGDGVLELLSLAVAGRREMTGSAFANGYVREKVNFD